MNQLSTFGLNPGLPKTEFTQLLASHPTVHLKSLRTSLFEEACKCDLLPTELQGLPLVNRRDTAIRPATKVLSEDIWSVFTCITSKTTIPRTLLRNGKRSSYFLKDAPRPSQVSPSRTDLIPLIPSVTNGIATNPDSSGASISQHLPVSEIISEQVSEHSQDQLPTSSHFSNTLISREISMLKEELRTIKADNASIHNKLPVKFPPNAEVRFGHMLKNIKDELSLLHTRFDEVLATSQIPSPQASSSLTSASNINPHDLTISTWNCRGLLNAKPYLHELVMEGSDVIVLNEHWLWPFQLNSLCDIHPDYQGYGVSDHRLNESSTLTRGCGGVGVIWKKSLQVSPITNVQSDRLCAIRISLSEYSCVNVICAYLPSSDHSDDEFRTYVNDLASLISALESSGPTIILGDLNAHLNDASPDTRAQILLDVIHNYDLCIMSLSSISTGPGYTFFSGNSRTTVDYILANTCISHRIAKCYTHGHHELNFSDHLPLSVVLSANQVSETMTTAVRSKINWKKAVHDDLISLYSSEVSNSIFPLLLSTSQSADGLNNEIITVCNILTNAAASHLPSVRPRKVKPHINDPELRLLCKRSRKVWENWKSAGRPCEGQLYEDKRDAKKAVRQFVSSSRAKMERAKIQSRDLLFRENSNNRFKSSTSKVECRGLKIGDDICIDSQEIVNHFSDHFANLAKSSPSSPLRNATSDVSHIELTSFLSCDNLLDDEIRVEEIEGALKTLKLGKSGGIDSLDPEHIYFGGDILKLWLKKIFNTIVSIDELPASLNEGLIIPVHKGKGKDPFLPGSYRGITLSSVISKLFEIILLQRLSPVLKDAGVPDFAQTAYQKGLSCADAIFATQEALLTHVRDGGKPLLCFYDIEKAFDSVELPILLRQLHTIGINGKLWRLLKHWYSTSSARVRVNGHISNSFNISRGVKQGSVLSPTLFLTVMDPLMKRLRESDCGLHVRGTYMGAAVHADDLRTTAASAEVVSQQNAVINQFARDSCLRLNTSKTEVVKISPLSQEESLVVELESHTLPAVNAAKCLGVWWNSSLSAKHSVCENVNKARRAFFALGRLGAFQGDLNPLSSCSIFETCITPTLLYGCETWLLDSTSLSTLESFQHEIGCRILRAPKFYSKASIRIALHWPTVATRILIRKLNFLSKLLRGNQDTISQRVFSSLAIDDIYDISIIQQCRMLESELDTCVLVKCLSDPENAPNIVKESKEYILRSDFRNLLASTSNSAAPAAHIATHTSWRRLWDIALDKGVKGTRVMQNIFKELCRPRSCFRCTICDTNVPENISCLQHACDAHPYKMENTSYDQLLSLLIAADSLDPILSSGKSLSKASSLWKLK